MKIWDSVYRNEVTKEYKVSFCTTCMGRLYDLKKTLPTNIKHNRAYPHVEFVILDYNSQDGLGDWIKKHMMPHIESGRLVYYRTEEPTTFSMAHSRNIAFKVATGDIVNNVDADNYTINKEIGVPEECFAARINRFANECPEKAIFAKGRRSMHGRIGFFKQEFIDLLGGYDEDLEGYGHDDHDLVHRAWALGFTMYWWGGQYCWRIKTSRKDKNMNMKRHWKETEKENKAKSAANLAAGRYKANEGKHWGKAILIKNFETVVEV